MEIEDHIKAYLAGGLTQKERAELESRLEQDSDFAQTFQHIQASYHLLRLDRQNAYRDTLKALASGQKSNPTPKSVSPFSLSWYHIAAAILILLVPLWLLLNQNSDPESLFDQYFTPYPDVFSLRNGDSSLDSLLQMGLHAYNLQEYKAATETFMALYEIGETQEAVVFYLAMSHLGQKEGKAAIPLLQSILPESAFSEAAEWYLALALLLEQQIPEAKQQLGNISKKIQHSYQKQAKEIRKDL